eukprot:541779_1
MATKPKGKFRSVRKKPDDDIESSPSHSPDNKTSNKSSNISNNNSNDYLGLNSSINSLSHQRAPSQSVMVRLKRLDTLRLNQRIKVRDYGYGTIQFLGCVHFAQGLFVGVELDEPNGKHDGKVKGKRYFKCRDKHGYMAPHETFELFGKSKKKLLNRKPKLKPSKSSNKSSKSTKNTKSKLLNKSTSSPPFSTKDSASKIKGKKKKKKKDVLNDSKKDLLSVKMPTLHGDNISPSKS